MPPAAELVEGVGMYWWWLAACSACAALLGAAAALLATRRAWRSARRLSARAHGHDQLVELGQLAAGLAHEIKNPLSTINVNLKLLAEDVGRNSDDTHQRWLHRIRNVQEETNRVAGILDDFLRYAGRYELALEESDLGRLIEELADFFRPQAEAARIVLRTSLPPGGAPCRVDSKLVKQALLNLMLNAVDAMDGGGELLVRLSTLRDKAVVEVIDTGPGIPPEHLPRIFEAYYSTKKHGTGLGLPTTRRIVREHGGTIRVESEPGKGTRFIVSLPMSAPARRSPAPVPAPQA